VRASTGLIAIGALALGCRAIAPAPEPPHSARRSTESADAQRGEAERRPEPERERSASAKARQDGLVVTATAYNSLPSQGVGGGKHGAWGDRLEPGMKTIAVSHDLIALGLTRGAVVRIEGLPGEYTVRDRLPRRWKRRIEIYMGRNVRAARACGRREVRIYPSEEIADEAPAAAPID